MEFTRPVFCFQKKCSWTVAQHSALATFCGDLEYSLPYRKEVSVDTSVPRAYSSAAGWYCLTTQEYLVNTLCLSPGDSLMYSGWCFSNRRAVRSVSTFVMLCAKCARWPLILSYKFTVTSHFVIGWSQWCELWLWWPTDPKVYYHKDFSSLMKTTCYMCDQMCFRALHLSNFSRKLIYKSENICYPTLCLKLRFRIFVYHIATLIESYIGLSPDVLGDISEPQALAEQDIPFPFLLSSFHRTLSFFPLLTNSTILPLNSGYYLSLLFKWFVYE